MVHQFAVEPHTSSSDPWDWVQYHGSNSWHEGTRSQYSGNGGLAHIYKPIVHGCVFYISRNYQLLPATSAHEPHTINLKNHRQANLTKQLYAMPTHGDPVQHGYRPIAWRFPRLPRLRTHPAPVQRSQYVLHLSHDDAWNILRDIKEYAEDELRHRNNLEATSRIKRQRHCRRHSSKCVVMVVSVDSAEVDAEGRRCFNKRHAVADPPPDTSSRSTVIELMNWANDICTYHPSTEFKSSISFFQNGYNEAAKALRQPDLTMAPKTYKSKGTVSRIFCQDAPKQGKSWWTWVCGWFGGACVNPDRR